MDDYDKKRKQEQDGYIARIAETRGILAAVFAKLGYTLQPEWDPDAVPCHPGVYATARMHDSVIHADADNYGTKDRIRFYTEYPEQSRYYTNDLAKPEITVSRSKPVEQIAREVWRRLLPDYEKALPEARKRLGESKASEAAKLANLRRLLGREPTENEARDGRCSIDGAGAGHVWGSMHVMSEDATLELRSVPIDLAARILALVREDRLKHDAEQTTGGER